MTDGLMNARAAWPWREHQELELLRAQVKKDGVELSRARCEIERLKNDNRQLAQEKHDAGAPARRLAGEISEETERLREIAEDLLSGADSMALFRIRYEAWKQRQ